jgi:hypothetical protein
VPAEKAGTLISTWTQKQETKALLGTTDQSLPRADRDRLIVNIAETQQQGVPLDQIATFLNELSRAVKNRSVSASDVAVSVSVMPDLATTTSSPGTSRDVLAAALNAGYDPESLRQIPGALERAHRTNARPAASIAKNATEAIAKGTPASTMLRTLFQGTNPNAAPASQNASSVFCVFPQIPAPDYSVTRPFGLALTLTDQEESYHFRLQTSGTAPLT